MFRNKSRTKYWIIGTILAAALLLVWGRIAGDSAKAKRTNREVALACTTDMATKFHIHPQLEIIIDGQKQEIPVNIGITNFCMNALHTHDTSGVIHVESPEKRDFTVADFFAVWGKPFSKDQILDSKADDTHMIKVTVDTVEVDSYENTVLRDGEKIVISYEIKK